MDKLVEECAPCPAAFWDDVHRYHGVGLRHNEVRSAMACHPAEVHGNSLNHVLFPFTHHQKGAVMDRSGLAIAGLALIVGLMVPGFSEAAEAGPAHPTWWGYYEGSGSVPGSYTLYPNRPNPFNPDTEIGYALSASRRMRLAV